MNASQLAAPVQVLEINVRMKNVILSKTDPEKS